MMLNATGLKYRYQDGKTIKFPEIEIERGQRVLISGVSGCGKTTLLSLIAGTLKLQDGDITFDKNEYSKIGYWKIFLDIH